MREGFEGRHHDGGTCLVDQPDLAVLSSGRGSSVRAESSRRPSAITDSGQAIVFLFDDCVTLASTGFQSLAVENPHMTTHVADQSTVLQTMGGIGNAFAAHAQHV